MRCTNRCEQFIKTLVNVATDFHVRSPTDPSLFVFRETCKQAWREMGVYRSRAGSYTVIKPCMVPFTPWLLQLWPDANQSASKACVADKAEGIREIKLRWHAVIYIAIDLLLQQINHLFPSTAFLIFSRNSRQTNYSACAVMLDVWLGGHAGNCVNPGCGFTPERCCGGFRQKGAVLPPFGCLPKSWLIRLTGQYLDCTGLSEVMCANYFKDF